MDSMGKSEPSGKTWLGVTLYGHRKVVLERLLPGKKPGSLKLRLIGICALEAFRSLKALQVLRSTVTAK